MYTTSHAHHDTAHHAHEARPANPATRQTLQHTRSALQGPRVTDRGPWARDLGKQEALRTYRDIPLFPALSIDIGAIMPDERYAGEVVTPRKVAQLPEFFGTAPKRMRTPDKQIPKSIKYVISIGTV